MRLAAALWGSLPVLLGGVVWLLVRWYTWRHQDVRRTYGWRPALAAFAVWGVLAAVTGYAVHATQRKLMTDAWTRLQFEMDRIEGDIQQQFASLLPVLQGVRSAQASGLPLGHDGLHNYVASRDLGQEFPGVMGLGIASAKLLSADSASARVALAGGAQFEPDAVQQWLSGTEWDSAPIVHEALVRAARSGRAALTGPVPLGKGATALPVLFYAMPVYRALAVPPTQGERLRTLQSFVLAPVSLPDFLAGVTIGAQGPVVFELYDGLEIDPALRIFGADDMEAVPHAPMFEDRRNVLVGQRFFQLRVFTTSVFESAVDTRLVAYIAGAGSTLGVLFGFITWLLMIGRARALSLARGMTRDLKRLAMVAERTSNAVIISDAAGHIEWVNEGFTRMTGYALSEVLGRNPGSFLQSPHTSASAKAAMRSAIAQGQSCKQRMVNVAKNGREYWVDMELQPLRDVHGRLEGFMAVQEDVSEQVASHQALAREKERADGILLGTNVGTWQFNFLTGETRVNEQWIRMLGYEPAEVESDLGAFWAALVKPEDQVRMNNLMEACRNGTAQRYEADLRVRTKNGEWMWILSRAAVLTHDAQGRPEWVAGVHMDVTEQRRTEGGLRDMQAFLDRSGRAAGVGAWEIDLKTQRIKWSDQTCEIHGVDHGYQPTWAELLSFYPPHDRDRLQDAMEQAPLTLAGLDLTLPFTRRDGDAKWVHIVGEVEFDDSGPVRLVGAIQDVTRVKVAEMELMQTSMMLQSVLDSAVQVAVIATNLERVITVFNKGAEQMLGYRAEEVLHQKTASMLFELEQLSAIKELLALESGHEPDAAAIFAYVVAHPELHEWTFLRKDHTRLTVSFLVSPLRDQSGELVGYLGIAHDITQQKQQETRLRQAMLSAEAASVAKSQFLANMSHEIRTPMNAILGMLRLLHNTPLSVQQKDYADKSEGAAKSLLGLLNDILDFSKVEAGKLQLDPQPFLLDELLADMSVILSSNLGGKPLDLIFDIDPHLPARMVGDALRIKQILINLGGNALKFTASGQVTLRWQMLSRVGNRVRMLLAVQDTGIGIAPENQGRIFEGFSQAEASTTRKYGGTGLGLAISQRLVRLMGSELKLQSVLGQGSTLSFMLDLLAPAAVDAVEAPASEGMPRLLLVDDTEASRAAIAQSVSALGWSVTACGSGQEALECLAVSPGERPPFDAILLDERMPDMDGWETFQAICARLALGQRPSIVLLAGQGREVLAQQWAAELAQLDGVLVKPLTSGMILRAVTVALQRGQGAPAPAPDAQRRLQRLAGMRILVVEDNPINQQVARELLVAEGAVVQLADNGQLGVDALRQTPEAFDVVLMDLQMPVLDGLSAARMVRQELGLRELPVIAMTANAMVSDRDACLAAGMNDHVGKPFDLNHLTQVLCQHVGSAWTAAPDTTQAAQPDTPEAGRPPGQWPDGIDVDAALGRMGGFADLYRDTLAAYLVECETLPQQLDAAMAAGDWDTARRLAHSFKGLSATVGVTELQTRALAVEQALKSAATGAAAGDAMAVLAQAIVRMIPKLRGLCAQLAQPVVQAETGVSAQTAGPADALRAPLGNLLKLLQVQDMQALHDYAVLRQGLEDPDAECWQALDTAMAALDFGLAEAECTQLIERLQGH